VTILQSLRVCLHVEGTSLEIIMKTIVFFVLGLVLMIPALTGAVDVVWWFYTNHALSSIEWDSFRPLIAYGFAALGCMLWVYAA